MNTLKILAAGAILVTSAFADDITDNVGTVYHNVKILRIEPDGLNIQHAGGIAKIFFVELPTDIQQKYGYDPSRSSRYRQKVLQAQQQQRANELQAEAQLQANPFPVDVFNIIAIKDKSVKTISGISAYFSEFGEGPIMRPVYGGLYRIKFSIKNRSASDITARIQYGDFLKDVYVPALSRKEGEEISGIEKYYELFVTVNGEKKAFSFNW